MGYVLNYTIEEYLRTEDTKDFDFVAQNLKPENKFAGRAWWTENMTFNEFHTIISILENPTLLDIKDLFVHLYRIRGNIQQSADEIFLKEKALQFFRARKFIEQFIQGKLKLEEKMLYADPDPRMLEINGYERLKPFNVLLSKVKIAEQFGKDPEEVGNWKYDKVLNLMAVNNVVAEIRNKLNG